MIRSWLRHTWLYRPYTTVKYRLSSRAREELFTAFRRDNIWGEPESVSGAGSSLAGTEQIRAALPALLHELGIRSLLDVPCGDFNWMRQVDLDGIAYTGADIVTDLIADLQATYGSEERRFIRLDLISDRIPPGFDAILVRDLFLHLPNAGVKRSLGNIARSDARWLLASTVRTGARNNDGRLGSHRRLDLTQPPFNLPPPQRLLPDPDLAAGPDKTLGVWPLSAVH